MTISHEGSNVTIGLDKDIVLGDTSHGNGGSLNVYSDTTEGNNLSNHVSINGSTISVNYKNKAGSDARGVILGVGKEDSKPDGYIAFNNVDGNYTYLHASTDASDDKKGRLEYVGTDGNKKYIANLDDVSTAVNNAKTKYYSVNENLPKDDNYSNESNDGAVGMGSIAAGFNTHADGIASTVAGSYSGVLNQNSKGAFDLRGATALSYGAFNINQNTDTDTGKIFSGVANSIVGQANATIDSNAAIIYGAGNTVTNSYRAIDPSKFDLSKVEQDIAKKDAEAVAKDLQEAVPTSGGQVMVMGGGNNVESAYMTQVVGVGNTVKGNQVQNDKSEWVTDKSIKDYNPERSSQYNYVDGFSNEVINGKHDYVIGANNTVTGDSYDDKDAKKYSNESNIIFGDNHTVTNTKNAVIIGSSDTQMTLDQGDRATAIGHNASAQRDALAVGVNTQARGNAVALGTYSTAHNNSIAIGTKATAVSSQNLAIGWEAHIGNITTDDEKIKNAIALGSDSQVRVNDLLESDNNRGVLSIGDKDKERRIIHVRAGVNDTDAVNVSQLKSVQSGLTDKGLTFVTNDGERTAKLGSKVTIQGTAKKAGHEYTADNLTTEIDKDGNITIKMDKNISAEKLAVNGKDGKNGQPGTAGSIGINGQDGQSGVGIDGKDGISIKGKDGQDGVTIKAVDGQNGTEGHIGLTGPAGTNGKDGTNAVDITVKNGYDGANGINGKNGVDGTSLTRIVYTDKTGEHQVATMEDGMKYAGDNYVAASEGKAEQNIINKKLNNTLDIIGGADSTKLTEKNIGVNDVGGQLKVQLADELSGIKSISNQQTKDGTTTGAKITLGDTGNVDVNGGKITNVGSGADASGNYTDETKENAANIGDVQAITNSATADLTGKGLKFAANSGDEYTAKLGSTVKIQGTDKKDGHEYTADNLTTEIDKDGNITIKMDKNISAEKLAVNGKDGKNGQPGTAGSIGINGQDGQSGVGIDGKDGISIKGKDGQDGVTIKAVDGQNGTEGHIGLTGPAGTNGKDGTNAVDITVKNGYDGANGINGKNGVDGTSLTRIVYTDGTGEHQVATLEDGLKFKGDDTTVIAKKLNNTLDIIGGADSKNLTEGNIGVNSTDKGQLKVQLAKDLTGITSISNQKTEGDKTTGAKITLGADGNVDVNGGKITNVGSGIEKDGNGKYTVTNQNKYNAANVGDVQNIVNDAKKDMTDGANGLNSKANVDASNIGENMKDAKGNKASAAEITKNKEAWASAIGTDTVAKGNKQLVTSDAVATALDSKADKSYVDKQLDTKANKSDVYTKDQTYSKTEVDSKVSNITTGLDGKAGKDLDNISDKGQQVIHNIAKDAVEVVDGTNTTVTKIEGTNTTPTKYAVNVEGKGKVASGDTGLISGDTLYKEVHVDKDGAYIKGSNTVGQNLSTLDTGLKTTSDLIHTNAKGDTIQIGGNSTATKIDISGKDKDGKSTGRVITGIVSDVNDPNSAANVGYVNGITSASNEQIYHDMNMQYNHVENDISRAAAGSNALAALHPMQEFDPDDKAQFALGYGHYRNSNAGAVGAFYQPDENSMVNFGVSFGNGDAGINAGVTFKFGPGGLGHHALTKTQMAKVIDAQSKEIDELKKDNADKDKRIDALEQKMTEILAKLDKSKD